MDGGIDLLQVRPLLGSRRGGFEEFCCQLARRDDRPPAGSRFIRLEGAGGDGGVECYWTTPDGDEWGYQAKFITDLDRAQINDSVTTAFRIHPRLTHYTVCLPFDLAGPTGRPGISQQERWGQWVAEWQAIAANDHRTVDFELWTRSELIDRLTASDPGGGRRRFWFDLTRLSPDWFDQHLRDATADAGPRYHPELSVHVPITNVLDAFGETARFRAACRVELRKFDKHLSRWRSRIQARSSESPARSDSGDEGSTQNDQESAEDATRLMRDALSPLDAVLAALQAPIADSVSSIGDVPALLSAARAAVGDARAMLGAQLEERHGRGAMGNASFRQFEAEYMVRFPAEDYDLAGDIAVALGSVESLLSAPGVEAAKIGVLLVTGAAGAGKTHAVCDAAIQRLRDDALPSIVVLGEKLGGGEFWDQVRSILGLPGTVGRDELLEALDAAGETAGAPLVLFVDALNERVPRSAWKSELASVIAQTERYPFIRLCLTCRSTYLDAVVPDGFQPPRFDHRGFTGVEFEAVFAFFTHFGLEPPTVPLLQPEYSNPLFLRMVCVGLTRSHGGGAAIPLSLDRVVEMLLETAEGAAADRLDIDARSGLVHRAIDAVLEGMAGHGLHLSWSEADDRVNGLLPDRPRSRSLLDFLLREGLLTEVGTVHGNDQVRFGFERLGEYLFVAKTLQGLAPEDLPALLAPGGTLDASLGDDSSTHSQGLVEALAILVPERHGIELADLGLDLPRRDVLAAVLSSLAWRRPETITESMEDVIREGLSDPQLMALAMEELLSLSVRPGHPLGSQWFDLLMRSLDQPQRDQNMAGFLHLSWEDGLAARRLSAWALRSDLGHVSRETTLDWAQTLLWLCIAPDRRVRDHATMAVVALMGRDPTALPELIGRMADVDDEYVVERLLLATYGVLIRVGPSDSIGPTASAVWHRYFEGETPLNALLRDHARCILELASARDALPETIDLARVVAPYESHRLPELEQETEQPVTSSKGRRRTPPRAEGADESATLPPVGDDGTAWRSVRRSIDDDDFAVYTMTSVLDTRNRPTLNLDACKAWLLREIESMGFGGSGFDAYDERMLYQYGGGRGKPDWAERLGKKYQWIALARLAGIVGDHIKVIPEFHEDEVVTDPPGLQADHLRDLDPTILVTGSQTSDGGSWWSALDVDFRPDLDDSAWLDSLGFPDSSQLIEVRDPSDSSDWFVLQSYCEWDNRLDNQDYDRPWRQCWLHVRSYIVPERGSGRFWKWLVDQDFHGRWMPEGGQWVPYVYEGEYPWSSQARRGIQPLMTPDYRDERLPVHVSPSALDQSLEFEYDAFHDETIHLLLPAPVLVSPELGLRADGMGGYVSSTGESILRTPSLLEPGPRALLVERNWMQTFLGDRGLSLNPPPIRLNS